MFARPTPLLLLSRLSPARGDLQTVVITMLCAADRYRTWLAWLLTVRRLRPLSLIKVESDCFDPIRNPVELPKLQSWHLRRRRSVRNLSRSSISKESSTTLNTSASSASSVAQVYKPIGSLTPSGTHARKGICVSSQTHGRNASGSTSLTRSVGRSRSVTKSKTSTTKGRTSSYKRSSNSTRSWMEVS